MMYSIGFTIERETHTVNGIGAESMELELN